MKARRLRWQGATRQRQILDRLRTELASWLKQWSTNPALLALQAADADARTTPPSAGWTWFVGTGAAGRLRFGLPERALAGLGGLLAQAAASDELGLGHRVGRRALNALLLQWAGGIGKQASVAVDAVPEPDDIDPRFGGLSFRLGGTDFDAMLWLDVDLCEHWLPTPQTSLPALAPRAAALGGESLQLDVILDLGQTRLLDTHGLAVGDVLVSRTPLDSAFALIHPDARQLAKVRLYRQDRRRALQLESFVSARAKS